MLKEFVGFANLLKVDLCPRIWLVLNLASPLYWGTLDQIICINFFLKHKEFINEISYNLFLIEKLKSARGSSFFFI